MVQGNWIEQMVQTSSTNFDFSRLLNGNEYMFDLEKDMSYSHKKYTSSSH